MRVWQISGKGKVANISYLVFRYFFCVSSTFTCCSCGEKSLTLSWLNKLKCARFYSSHTYMPCSHYGLFMHKLYTYLCLCFVVIIAFLWDYREKSWAKIWVISGSLLTALMSTFVVTLFYEEKIVAPKWRNSFPTLLPSSFKIFTFFLEIDASAMSWKWVKVESWIFV